MRKINEKINKTGIVNMCKTAVKKLNNTKKNIIAFFYPF